MAITCPEVERSSLVTGSSASLAFKASLSIDSTLGTQVQSHISGGERMAQRIQDNLVRIGFWWCRMLHDAPQWPIHSGYRCRTCGRRHAVRW